MQLSTETNCIQTHLRKHQGSSQASCCNCAYDRIWTHKVTDMGHMVLTDLLQHSNLPSPSTSLIKQMHKQQREDFAWLEGLRQHHQENQLGHKQVKP